MTVRVDEDIVHLEGACPVNDAEPLLAALQVIPAVIVDVSTVTRLHLAVVQLLMASRATIRGVPADPFLRDFVLPQLRRHPEEDALPIQAPSI